MTLDEEVPKNRSFLSRLINPFEEDARDSTAYFMVADFCSIRFVVFNFVDDFGNRQSSSLLIALNSADICLCSALPRRLSVLRFLNELLSISYSFRGRSCCPVEENDFFRPFSNRRCGTCITPE